MFDVYPTNRIPEQAGPKLKMGRPDDKYEREADAVMRMPDSLVQMQPIAEDEEELQMKPVLQPKRNVSAETSPEITRQINSSKGSGSSMAPEIQQEMAHKMGADFDGVNIHTDSNAHRLNQQLGAKAFTHGSDIYFNKQEYNPNSSEGKRLLAHELTHVVQQGRSEPPGIQRTIELRPPGQGEATAFDRAQELVDRLNEQTLAVMYTLGADGRTLQYRIILPNALSEFDFQMMDFIDLEQVIPLRLITSQGLVGGNPIVGDSFLHGYVDLDDLLASDALAFQSFLVHFLQERAVTRRYEQRIGTPGLDPNTPAGSRTFRRGHRAGHEAQAEHWRDVMGDPSIRFSNEFINNRGDGHIIFRSQAHNYRIFITLDRAARSAAGRASRLTTGGRTRIRFNNQWLSVEEFLERGIVPGSGFRLRLPQLGQGFNRPLDLGLEFGELQLDPGIQTQIQNLRNLGRSAQPAGSPAQLPEVPSPSPPAADSSRSLSFNQSLTRLPGPNTDLIDWLSVQNELTRRGVFLDDRLANSIVSVWQSNYLFFNQTLGLDTEQSAFWTNKTIGRAVGSGLSYDYPTLSERSDREAGTSSTIFPVSDVVIFLWDQL